MKKQNIEKALYEAVKLTTKDNEIRRGYLIPSRWFKGKYTILPLNDVNSTYTYPASSIKSIQYLRNGVTLIWK